MQASTDVSSKGLDLTTASDDIHKRCFHLAMAGFSKDIGCGGCASLPDDMSIGPLQVLSNKSGMWS